MRGAHRALIVADKAAFFGGLLNSLLDNRFDSLSNGLLLTRFI